MKICLSLSSTLQCASSTYRRSVPRWGPWLKRYRTAGCACRYARTPLYTPHFSRLCGVFLNSRGQRPEWNQQLWNSTSSPDFTRDERVSRYLICDSSATLNASFLTEKSCRWFRKQREKNVAPQTAWNYPPPQFRHSAAHWRYGPRVEFTLGAALVSRCEMWR